MLLHKLQDLTNQLIELEKHFNTVELKNFGDISGSYGAHRALQNKSGSSRYLSFSLAYGYHLWIPILHLD